MFENAILIPARRVPWIKIGIVGSGIAGAVGFAVYWWTSKIASVNNQVELIQKDFSKREIQEEYKKRKEAEQRECDKTIMQYGKNWGCFKEYKNQ